MCPRADRARGHTLLRIAEVDLYRPLWSARVLDEMVFAIEHVHPDLADGRARARADTMLGAFDDACVTDWESLEQGLRLPDPDDRHVVAAALRGRAGLIVTMNLKDFPVGVLSAVGLEVQHPDEFLMNQLDLEPDLTMATLHRQAAATNRPSLQTQDILTRLARCGVPQFAAHAGQQLWRGR